MALVDTTWYVNFGNGTSTGYYAVAQRAPSTAVAAGAIRRQFTTPAVGSERCFICTVAGTTSASADATWTLTRGAKSALDGTVQWQECSGQAALNGDLTNTATWAQVKAATPAVLGQVIKRSNNASYQICTTAGAMSASEPAFSDTAGVTTTDTTAVWTSLGAVSNFTGGQAPHARLLSALTSTWFASGNTVYVGNNHAETTSSGPIYGTGTVSPLMARILCHNSAASYPPTTSDLATGATITTTGGASITIRPDGAFYFYGLTFLSSVTTGNAIQVGGSTTASTWYYFDNCSFQITVGGGSYITIGGTNAASWSNVFFNNTTVKFADVLQYIFVPFVQFTWRNTGQVLVSGSTVPTALIRPSVSSTGYIGSVLLEALDLSQLTGSLFANAGSAAGSLLVKDCKLNATTTVTTPINTGMTVQLSASAADATSYKSSRHTYEAVETTETSIVRTGGYADPTGQAQSRKIVTTANTQWLRPYQAQPLAVWNADVGSSKTVTVYGTVNSGSLPLNDEIWLDVSYLGDAGFAAGVLPATWNFYDKSANMSLSNGDLTATTTNFSVGVRGITGKSSGKWYFEVTMANGSSTADFVGLGLASVNLTTQAGAGATAVTSGNINVNAVSVSLFYNLSNGSIVRIAVDLTAQLIWFSVPSGIWNNNAANNPATGVGGISIASISTGPLYPLFCVGAASGHAATANFGATAFAGTVPSGFTAGWPTEVTPPSPRGSVATSTKAKVLDAGVSVTSDSSVWAVSTATTWDLITATAVTLSGGNLVATSTGTTSASQGARGADEVGKISGKFYFEMTDTSLGSSIGVNRAFGVGTTASTFSGMGGNATSGAVTYHGSGNIWANGSNSGSTIGVSVGGQATGIAVDLDNRQIWFRRGAAGNWNGSGTANPTTNVGGIAIPSGTMVPFCVFGGTGGVTGVATTANFGAASFSGTVPSGFTSGWTNVWSPFKLVATLTPQLPGYLIPQVKVAKASTTYYVDPLATVT